MQSLVPDTDGAGYWLVASDGGIFAFDAEFYSSMGDTRINRPITGMVACAVEQNSAVKARWSRGADVVAALILLPMLALVAARLLRLDDRSGRIFAVQTLVPLALLPAYVMAVAACLARRWLIGTVAVVVAVIHLAWTSPFAGIGRPEEQASGPGFTLAIANVAADNAAPEEVAAVLAGVEADVVVVIELTPVLQVALERAGFSERYPFHVADARAGFFGSGIYSRVPIAEAQRVEFGGLPTVRAALTVGEKRVDLVAIHTIQPLADLATLRRQHAELTAMADATVGPLILAGDFNATAQHRPFRQLLRSRLRDSHAERGHNLARTWPAHTRLPPFALLDHVLVSEEIAVRVVAEFRIPHSDHRGVRTELQLR